MSKRKYVERARDIGEFEVLKVPCESDVRMRNPLMQCNVRTVCSRGSRKKEVNELQRPCVGYSQMVSDGYMQRFRAVCNAVCRRRAQVWRWYVSRDSIKGRWLCARSRRGRVVRKVMRGATDNGTEERKMDGDPDWDCSVRVLRGCGVDVLRRGGW